MKNIILLFFVCFIILFACTNRIIKKTAEISSTTEINLDDFKSFHPDSLYEISLSYFEDGDIEKGQALFVYAYRKGSLLARIDSANLHCEAGNKERGMEILDSLCGLNFPRAYIAMGILLEKSNKSTFLNYLNKGILLGEYGISEQLAFLYLKGDNSFFSNTHVTPDTLKAINYLTIAASHNEIGCQYILAEYYLSVDKKDSAIKYLNLCFNNKRENEQGYQQLAKGRLGELNVK